MLRYLLISLSLALTIGVSERTLADEPVRIQPATKPTDAIFFEAEEMRTDGQTWTVRPYEPDVCYSHPSGARLLYGTQGAEGTGTKEVVFAKQGRHRVWVRYLDCWSGGDHTPAWHPFRVRVLRDGQPIASKDFNLGSLRDTPDGRRKWDTYGRDFVWDYLDVEASAAGAYLVELTKISTGVDTFRFVDCVAITTNLQYVPNVRDFAAPLYVKFIFGKSEDNREPFFIWFGGSVGNWNLFRDRFVYGSFHAPADETWFRAGDESAWVNVRPTMKLAGDNSMRFTAFVDWTKPSASAEFTVLFSHTPSEAGLIRKFHRKGRGGGLIVMIDPSKPDEIASEFEWSQWTLATAARLPPPKGRQAARFPLIADCYHDVAYAPVEVIDTDLRAMTLLGFSGAENSLLGARRLGEHGLRFQTSQCTSYWLLKDQCYNQPDWPGIRHYQAENLKNYPDPDDPPWIKVGEEIGYLTFEHPGKCAVCAERFREYLRVRGGYSEHDAAAVVPVVDKASDPKLYYHTMRFRSQMLVDFMKGCTNVVREMRPGTQTFAQPSTELTSSMNMLHRGADQFELYKQQALTIAMVGDGNAGTPSQQTVGYTIDVLRSACKYHGQTFGTYNIINRPAWDVGAKAFAEVGHGARVIDYYSWGPFHSGAPDGCSRRVTLYPVLQEFNHAVGAVEAELLQARRVPSKVALLYSNTTDIWDLTEPRRLLFGAEPMYLHLLLTHTGYPLDILTEDDVLEGRAGEHEAILVSGSHLKGGVVAKLLQWADAGGLLYVGPGAAERNEYNEPTDELTAAIGLKRQAFRFQHPTSHEDGIPLMKVLAKATSEGRSFDVLGGFQSLANDTEGNVALRFDDAEASPAAVEIVHGRGRVTFLGFFPGLSYVHGACVPMSAERQELRAQGKPLHTLCPCSYPDAHRALFEAILKPLLWKPPVSVSDYLVEASLLSGESAHVLALSNWSGERRQIEAAVTLPGGSGQPRSVVNPLTDVRVEGDTVRFTMEIGRGDFVVLPARVAK